MGSIISREKICCFVKNHPTIQHMKDPKPRLQPQNESDIDSTEDDHILNDALEVPKEEEKKIEAKENITQLNHNLSPAKKSVITEKEGTVSANISKKDNNETKDKKREVRDSRKTKRKTFMDNLTEKSDAIKQTVRRSRQVDSNDGISKESNTASLENKKSEKSDAIKRDARRNRQVDLNDGISEESSTASLEKKESEKLGAIKQTGPNSKVPTASAKSKETSNSTTTFSGQIKSGMRKATMMGMEAFKFDKIEEAVQRNSKVKKESKENNINLKKCVMVTIYAGQDLVAKDRNIIGIRAKSDPFVEIYYGDKRVGKTSTIPKTLDPTWGGSLGEKFNFEMTTEELSTIFDETYVKCIIFDADKLSSSDPMGTVILSVPKKINTESVNWHKVTKGKRPHYCRNARGQLKVGIEVRESESDFFSQAEKGKKKSKPKSNLPWKRDKKKKRKVKDEKNSA